MKFEHDENCYYGSTYTFIVFIPHNEKVSPIQIKFKILWQINFLMNFFLDTYNRSVRLITYYRFKFQYNLFTSGCVMHTQGENNSNKNNIFKIFCILISNCIDIQIKNRYTFGILGFCLYFISRVITDLLSQVRRSALQERTVTPQAALKSCRNRLASSPIQ